MELNQLLIIAELQERVLSSEVGSCWKLFDRQVNRVALSLVLSNAHSPVMIL